MWKGHFSSTAEADRVKNIAAGITRGKQLEKYLISGKYEKILYRVLLKVVQIF
jgi:hypothetical protein